jgi:Flp pilus assembly protein TadG
MKPAHSQKVDGRRAGTGQKGVVAVELALMLPILLLFLAVTVDLGLLMREHQILQNAAREGARMSSLPRNQVGPWNPAADLDTIRQRVVDYLAEEGITISTADVDVVQDRLINLAATSVTASEVSVSYARDPLIGFVLPGPVTLSGEAVFKNLY